MKPDNSERDQIFGSLKLQEMDLKKREMALKEREMALKENADAKNRRLQIIVALLTGVLATAIPAVVTRLNNQTEIEVKRLELYNELHDKFWQQLQKGCLKEAKSFADYLSMVSDSTEDKQKWNTLSEQFSRDITKEQPDSCVRAGK